MLQELLLKCLNSHSVQTFVKRLHSQHSFSPLNSQNLGLPFISCKQRGFISQLCSPLIPYSISGIWPSVSLPYFPSKLVFLPDRSRSFSLGVRKTNVCLPSFALLRFKPVKLVAITKILTSPYSRF